MERLDVLMVVREAFPELKARGFFTVTNGVEYYYSGLQNMQIESIYKSFYDEYDFAFCVRCCYSVCDIKHESRWKRAEGNRHHYRTPALRIVSRMDMEGSPAQIASRMMNHYKANTLVIEQYNHPQFTIGYLKEYLASQGMLLIMKKDETVTDYTVKKKATSIHHVNVPVSQLSNACII